jgi:hypothetical protein
MYWKGKMPGESAPSQMPLELLPVPAVLRGAVLLAPNPRSEPAKSPTTGGLGGPVYSLKNELSISPGGGSTPGHLGAGTRESALEY